MKASVYHGPGDIRVENVPDAVLREPTDALVRVTHAGICGSDLWVYRGELELYGPAPSRVGHEFLGVVEDVGDDAHAPRGTAGDRPVHLPTDLRPAATAFRRSAARAASSAPAGRGQGEAVRVPLADGTLVAMPDDVDLSDDRLAAALATLTDVMGRPPRRPCVGVGAGGTAVIVGDGAVGLCAVLAARRPGAERVILLGHHADRLAIATSFGATDIVERGGRGRAVRELTDGGSRHVVECVGTRGYAVAIGSARPRGTVGQSAHRSMKSGCGTSTSAT